MSIQAHQRTSFPSGKCQVAGIVGGEVVTTSQFQNVAVFSLPRTL